MKKLVMVLALMMFVVVSCSMPKLVKVTDAPDPTATDVPIITEEITVPTATVSLSLEEEITEPLEHERLALFVEEFSNDDGTWNTGYWSNDAAMDEIVDGEYQMSVYEPDYLIWSETVAPGNSDVVMTVETRLVNGAVENGQGFICRYSDPENFYFLFVGNDGWYSVGKYENDVYSNLDSNWAPDGVIDPENNFLIGICSGSTIALSVNGTLLANVQDGSLPDGEVALYARTFDGGETTIAFDNFVIYSGDKEFVDIVVDLPQGYLEDGTLLFSDDFEDDSGPWEFGDYEDLTLEIIYGWLTYTLNTERWITWDVTSQVDAADVRMEAYFSNDAETDDNLQGFVCRFQDNDNFYYLGFGSDGYLRLGLQRNGEWENLINEFAEEWIDPTFNFVEATCIGNQLSLYVNGALFAQVSDPNNTFTTGDVGILVSSFEDPNVIISVDDFAVYSLE